MTSAIDATPRFEITQVREQDKNHIVMYAANASFLSEKGKVIAAYTQKLYPHAACDAITVARVDPLSEMAKKGLIYALCVDKILPPLVRALYGEHRANRSSANCHGAALVAAGLFPAMSYFESPTDLKLVSEKSYEIDLDQIESGDLVYLHKFHIFSHSFVFLDHDISLSMNGQRKPLLIHSTTTILHDYSYPRDSLKKAPSNEFPIKVIRKKRDWSYPDKVISSLTTFYNFADRNDSYQKPGDPNYCKAKACATLFQSYALKLCLSSSESEAARKIFSSWIAVMIPEALLSNRSNLARL